MKLLSEFDRLENRGVEVYEVVVVVVVVVHNAERAWVCVKIKGRGNSAEAASSALGHAQPRGPYSSRCILGSCESLG